MRILLFCFLVIFISCDKDNLSNDKITGSVNGESWEANGYYKENSPFKIDFDFTFEKENGINGDKETLFIFKIPCKIGTYPLTKNTSTRQDDNLHGSYFFLEEGDLMTSAYELVNKKENTITIEDVDKDGEIIRGAFNATFYNSSGLEDYPDTLRFENASFEVSYRD